MKYVLITPAHNEAAFIEKTFASMVAQTRLPERWVIVDDGSMDCTAKIVEKYVTRFPWIELVQRPQRLDRSFAAKVHAFNAGFEVIHPKLGVAGTPFTEDGGYDSTRDSFEGENHVAGGCQLFRHQCFEDVGGYIPNRAGGIDWIAVTTARMKGWKTRSFAEKRFHHYRTLGTAERSSAAASFSYGEKDYYLGGSPVWELFRVAYRMTRRPILIEGLALLSGYCWAALRRMKRPVTPELMRFHRREQMKKLRAIFRTLLSFKKVDNFSLVKTESHTRL